MPKMPTVTEAMAALRTLERFIGGVNDLTAQLTMLWDRGDEGRALVGTMPLPPERAPSTWKERVLTILRESAQPMTPMQITQEYVRRGWPTEGKDRRVLSNLIRSTLAFLKRTEEVTHRDGKYAVAPA